MIKMTKTDQKWSKIIKTKRSQCSKITKNCQKLSKIYKKIVITKNDQIKKISMPPKLPKITKILKKIAITINDQNYQKVN